jgi:hypothetical protein
LVPAEPAEFNQSRAFRGLVPADIGLDRKGEGLGGLLFVLGGEDTFDDEAYETP